jgi:hypothetical protein
VVDCEREQETAHERNQRKPRAQAGTDEHLLR